MLQLPKVIGHRGAMAYAPENTLASFREARRRGATWVEIDIKLTADGVPIVMHDASLKRTTGVDRWSPRRRAPSCPRTCRPSKLGDRLLPELGLGCNVEIKPCEGREAETARVTVATLRRCWPSILPPPLLSSFKQALARRRPRGGARVRARHPAARTQRRLARPRRRGRCSRRQHRRQEARGGSRAREVKQAGFALSVYTINDAALARALVAMGVDCVITDMPDVILAALN